MYTPINASVYTAAFCGALAGMAVSGRQPTDATVTDYDPFSVVAANFAQEFDTLAAQSLSSSLQVLLIEESCAGFWRDRLPVTNTLYPPSAFVNDCQAIFAILESAENNFSTNGITPPYISDPIGGLIFGSPQNGTQVATFDGTNTYFFATLAGSTYTLNQDTFLSQGTINAGIILHTAGYKLFCNGSFTNNGELSCDGANAVGVTAGTHSPIGTLGVGLAGANGHTGVGAGSSASPASSTNTLGDANPSGGAGGAGGAQAGGAGGVYLANTQNGGSHYLATMTTGFLYVQQAAGTGASLGIIQGGCGGGGGGSNDASANGGGGGGGAGAMILCLKQLINNGAIHANGGNGAAATGVTGDSGGGGGGGGGIINLITRYLTQNGTLTTTGGLGGAAFGSGVAGVNGNHGHINSFSA